VVREVPNANLRVLTSGLLPPDSTALLESTAMPRLLAELASDVDLVIVDSAPMAAGPDGAILAGMADAVILVIDTDHSNADASRRSAHDLHRARARVLGAVVYGSSSPGTVAVVNEFVPPSVVGSRERVAADVDQRVDSA
jgi:Mrp family chromosome partitioning ATPase